MEMNTPSQLERLRIKVHSSQRKPASWLPSALLAAGAILVLCPVSRAATAGGTDACQRTADALQCSCQAAAQSDYELALAKCENIVSSAKRKACQDQAAADLQEALQTCSDQRAARVAACARLGPAPYDPVIKASDFVATIDNPYFPLKPGTTFVYEGQTAAGLEHSEFAVTHNTRVILGVTCIEVRDRVFTDGVLTEDTLDWFAQDKDGNVWYFGENTHELEDGLISTIDGTFMAGVDGDKPGIVMKAHPAVGDFYRQEFSLGNAEDFAETISLTESVTVPAGSFHHCLRSQETSPLETDLLEQKFYAPGVGNVLEIDVHSGDRIELIQIRTD
jgi:hypothetical protein